MVGCQSHDGFDHVRSIQSADPGCSNHRCAGTQHQGLAFANQFGQAVHASRVGRIPLVVRPIQFAIEHIVGTDLHEVAVGPSTALGQPTYRDSIDCQGPVGVTLARIDRSPCRTVDHDVRTKRCDCSKHCISRRDIERGVIKGKDRVPRRCTNGDQVGAQLAGCSGDQHSH